MMNVPLNVCDYDLCVIILILIRIIFLWQNCFPFSSLWMWIFCFFFLPWKKGRFLLRTSDMHHWSSVPALSRSYSVWLISFAIYKGEIECGGVGLGIYSFSKSRNRKISLPAAVKSPCNDSSRSRNRLMSLWHVWNLTENKMVSVKIQRRDSERVYKSEDLSIFSWTVANTRPIEYLPHSVATDQAYHISISSLHVLSLRFVYSLRVAPSYYWMQPHRLSTMSTLSLLPQPMTLIPNRCHYQHKSLHHLIE